MRAWLSPSQKSENLSREHSKVSVALGCDTRVWGLENLELWFPNTGEDWCPSSKRLEGRNSFVCLYSAQTLRELAGVFDITETDSNSTFFQKSLIDTSRNNALPTTRVILSPRKLTPKVGYHTHRDRKYCVMVNLNNYINHTDVHF